MQVVAPGAQERAPAGHHAVPLVLHHQPVAAARLLRQRHALRRRGPLPADAPGDLLGATRGFMVIQDTTMRRWPRNRLLLVLILCARGCLRLFTERGTAVPAAPS